MHPFLSARTEVTNYEPRLRLILDKSTSLMDYLARVRQDGLCVEMVSPPQRWGVSRGERVVAEISDTPAFLAPSGAGALADLPVDHQFLSLANPCPEDSHDLLRMLSQSGDLTAFLRGLAEAGYRVTALNS
jgi:hypothetical protein